LEYITEKPENAMACIVGSTEFYIPFTAGIDIEAERKKMEEELKYYRGFLVSVMKKLDNEKFVNNASQQIVDAERKKQADAEARIRVLDEQLENLKKS
jgi:valyl-tRNA synthetase